MDWIVVIVALVVVTGFFVLKRMAFIAEDIAHEHLAKGALVIDVRSPAEFHRSKVPGAINIPLGTLREDFPQRVKDKSQMLLVHCLSGGRSAIAQQQLKRMGYPNVFNLGSLARAQHIFAVAKQRQVTAKAGSRRGKS
jgi:phage shock protein E